ncbi:hypothetical protein PG994_000433 [Apiospora phragmitis]|uniref:Uncharacterized protein n=1 Tax=Apiospora phragmitis TaxID=2905665 RepID=A0ABR1X6A1_9PEZI
MAVRIEYLGNAGEDFHGLTYQSYKAVFGLLREQDRNFISGHVFVSPGVFEQNTFKTSTII